MPNSTSIDQLAAKELRDRGVDKSTGTFKNHSVRIGNSSAVRIDKMKSDRIPFQGFRTATRIASGTEGLRKSAARALSIMARPGKLSAGKLLGAIKATQEYASRLARLGSQVRSGTLELYAPLVESLSNDELSKVFQMFQTPEADLLMTALAYEGRSNSEASDARRCSEVLFDMQALVIKELGNRTSRDTIEREIQKDPSIRPAGAAPRGGGAQGRSWNQRNGRPGRDLGAWSHEARERGRRGPGGDAEAQL